MEFKNKKCDDVFHASLAIFAFALIFAIAFLFINPVISTWVALLAIVPVCNMIGAGIVERKLSGVPFFRVNEQKKHKEHDKKEEIEEEKEIEQEAEQEQEEVKEMGSIATPVEEKKVEPVLREVVEPKIPKETKKKR